jgi:hypothetical protein
MTIRPCCSAIRVKSSGNCQNVPAGPTCKRSIEAQVTDRHDIFDEESRPRCNFLPDSRETAGRMQGLSASLFPLPSGRSAVPPPRQSS